MTNSNPHTLPLYRVTFSRITGQDRQGSDVLARPKEIGAVWPRKGDKQGGILQLDIIPIELTQRQGVIFLVPVSETQTAEPRYQSKAGRAYQQAVIGGAP